MHTIINSRLIPLGLFAFIPLAAWLGWSSREVWGNLLLVGTVGTLLLAGLLCDDQPRPRLPYAIYIFAGLVLVATAFSTYHYASIHGALTAMAGIGLFSLANATAGSRRTQRALASAMAFSGAAVAMHAISQVPWLDNLELGVASTWGWKNALAGFLVVSGTMTVALLAQSRGALGRTLGSLGLASIGSALYFTNAQAAWAALAAAVVLLVVCLFATATTGVKKISQGVATAALVGTLLTFGLLTLRATLQPAGNSNIARITGISPESSRTRVNYWKTSLQMVEDFPLFGVGLNNFTTWYTHYFREPWLYTISPHNYLLYLLVTTGVITTVVWVWLLAALALPIFRWLRQERRQPGDSAALTAGWIAAGGGLLAHSLLDLSLEVPALHLLWWLTLGLGYAGVCTVTAKPSRLERAVKAALAVGLSIVAVWLLVGDNSYQHGYNTLAKFNGAAAAIAQLERSAALVPWSADTQEALAQAHWEAVLQRAGARAEHLVSARRAAQRAVALDPASAHRHWILGQIYAKTQTTEQRYWPEAIAHLELAVTYDFHDPTYYYTLADVQQRAGLRQAAIITIDRGLALYPETEIRRITFGHVVYERLGLKQKLDELRALRQIIIRVEEMQ